MFDDDDDDDTDPEYPYSTSRVHCPNRGKTIHYVTGVSSREPLLSGSHNVFLNEGQARAVAKWLNEAFLAGKERVQTSIKQALNL